MRRIVVDTNFLERPELRSYLKRNPQNYAVIADYTAIEMYKCGELTALSKRVSIIRDYDSQIGIIKSTYHACAVRGRRAGLQNRLIDGFQTSIFPEFIRLLDSAIAGDVQTLDAFGEHVKAAKTQMQSLLAGSEIVINGMVEMYSNFSTADLQKIRAGRGIDVALSARGTSDILAMAYSFFSGHPNVRVIPNATELPYTYLFRVAVSAYFYTLDRAKDGIASNLSPAKVRNDMIDIYTLAYGTLFDGLFSGDERASRVFRLVKKYLEIRKVV
ncbi:conserved protein of unknown function [Pseudomonas sp. JV551A1]|uniref:Uncharacterized protein n=1 Tax=Pseudomonas inefficax TaxID=2078786 RepID=A0AAQ1P6G6_9PSED|nr:hypothetical protein [Pseudomonas]SPO53623.1 conserved protein of unknown function [Pseudomonas sp. JV551A1]SPO59416.1 conserved protein of unknown function [Pseudomonas inefficax]